MKIYNKVVVDTVSGEILYEDSYEYSGPVELAKGASKQQNDINAAQTNLANEQAAFYQTLQQAYQTQFANQTNILNSLQKSFLPILNAGPSQFGFSPQEVQALDSQAITGTAQQYSDAAKALGQQISGSMGNVMIPSGAVGSEEARLSNAAAATASNALLGIQQAGYQTGLSNYWNAAQALGGVSGQINPLGYAGAATSGGTAAGNTYGEAFNSATQINKENNAASPLSIVGGLLGGVASGFTGGLSSAIGNIGTDIGGLFNQGSNTSAPADFSDFTYSGGQSPGTGESSYG